jgi:glycosyltransferase involved in cell wall biosynthesis
MKIVYVSYANAKETNLNEWLNQLSFYTGILEEQSKQHKIVSIHCPQKKGRIFQKEVDYIFLKHHWYYFLFPSFINRHVAKENPDAVIVHGLHSGWQVCWLHFQLRKETNIFVWHHAEKPKTFPKSVWQKWADKFTDGYFFVSRKMAQPWVEKKQINSLTKVHEAMEASSPFYRIDKSQAIAHTKIKEGINYLWVGRLDENKDPITLVSAFLKFSADHPQASLYIIFKGGNLLSKVEKIINSSHSIILVGEKSHEELLHWYNSVDYIISTSHYEGSGIAVCEAMSCGCVPVLTNIHSFEKMTNNECGLLFKAGDANDLYEALNKSLKMNVSFQKELTLQQFKKSLSFKAIASSVNEAIKNA